MTVLSFGLHMAVMRMLSVLGRGREKTCMITRGGAPSPSPRVVMQKFPLLGGCPSSTSRHPGHGYGRRLGVISPTGSAEPWPDRGIDDMATRPWSIPADRDGGCSRCYDPHTNHPPAIPLRRALAARSVSCGGCSPLRRCPVGTAPVDSRCRSGCRNAGRRRPPFISAGGRILDRRSIAPRNRISPASAPQMPCRGRCRSRC
jgi:hypothetical protein